MNDVLAELLLFSDRLLTLRGPCNEVDIIEFETKFKFKLPNDYKAVIQAYNGIDLMGTTIYGISKNLQWMSLEECYAFEHNEVGNPMYDYLVPFSPDGGGNHYCFDLKTSDEVSCAIVFWQHDYQYSESDPPEVTHSSFLAWVKEVAIDWTLEDYDYEGNEK